MFQDAIEIGLQLDDFGVAEVQVGQPRDVADFLFGDLHACAALFRESL